MKYFTTILLVFSSLLLSAQSLLTAERASHFSKMALKCIHQEYPNKPGEVVGSDEDIKPVREYRPAFYGCFDWHSAVHGHWMLIKLLKTFPELPEAEQIKAAVAKNITAENIAVELDFFLDKNNRSFERTYGWAWFLKLVSELQGWDDPLAQKLEAALQPLTELLVQNYIEYLPKLVYPIRVGEHSNTAFGLSFALDYARMSKHKELEEIIVARAKYFYLNDKGCPISWEPSGYDFLSPCFSEAELMARVLTKDEFENWLSEFLAFDASNQPVLLSEPAKVSDRTDGKLVHLDELNFSRAWAYAIIASRLKTEYRPAFRQAAERHLLHSLDAVSDGNYEGEHWLASFAVYAMEQFDKMEK